MKKCSKCQVDKSVEEFAVSKAEQDGLQRVCRLCQKRYYQTNKEHALARQKADREARPKVYKARAQRFYIKNKEYITTRVKRYRATPKGKEVSYAISRRQIEQNPEKAAARKAVAYALQTGRLTRRPCEVCKSTHDIEAHHDSYAKEHWLDVRWLCPKHHKHHHMTIQ